QSRELLNADFQAILRAIGSAIANAEFDGANILDGSLSNGIQFLANAEADSFITLTGADLSLGGSIITIASSASIDSLSAAQDVLADLNTSIDAVNAALG